MYCSFLASGAILELGNMLNSFFEKLRTKEKKGYFTLTEVKIEVYAALKVLGEEQNPAHTSHYGCYNGHPIRL